MSHIFGRSLCPYVRMQWLAHAVTGMMTTWKGVASLGSRSSTSSPPLYHFSVLKKGEGVAGSIKKAKFNFLILLWKLVGKRKHFLKTFGNTDNSEKKLYQKLKINGSFWPANIRYGNIIIFIKITDGQRFKTTEHFINLIKLLKYGVESDR